MNADQRSEDKLNYSDIRIVSQPYLFLVLYHSTDLKTRWKVNNFPKRYYLIHASKGLHD